MYGKRRISLSAKDFIPGHRRFEEEYYRHYHASIELNLDELSFEVETQKEKRDHTRTTNRNYLYFKTKTKSEFIESLNFISTPKPSEQGEKEELDLEVDDGHHYESLNDRKSRVDHISFHFTWNRLIVETFKGNNPMIPYYTVQHGDTPEDRENLEKLQDFTRKVANEFEEREEVNIDPLKDTLRKNIQEGKYGNEVLDHLDDGDQCLKSGLLHPALSSYIHAIEWGAITTLSDDGIVDIIEQEKDGDYYYFAKGGKNILSIIEESYDIDQKTVERIESMNRAERRWMAHHKSGEVLEDEVLAVRSRLVTFLDQLFA